MASPVDNPFAALTFIAAPAILTNASSVLSLGTGNRIARVVDRTRVLNAELAGMAPHDKRRGPYMRQLERLKTRAHLLLRALRFFYASIGSFAAAALLSIIGALVVTTGSEAAFLVLSILGLFAGSAGVGGLVTGCIMMVRETQFAVETLEEDIALNRDSSAAT